LYVPNFGKGSYARTLAELASDAEDAGWEGFFLWNHLIDERNKRIPIVDPFVALAAIAMSTKRIRIGTTVTALPRYRPWIVARQAATLDEMSNGRMILGVGLGFPTGLEFDMFSENPDNKTRAEKLDEGLEVITGLWSGKPFSYQGKHYQFKETVFLPTPTQKPRIPIWVGGFWPYKGPFRRAAKWDGVIPLKLPVRQPKPQDLRDVLAYIQSQRTNTAPFDVAVIGWGTGRNRVRDAKKIQPYVDAGITWWLESLYGMRDSPKDMRSRIRQGPPGI
jgi:alkanesulfonate monooxygenase SsuD/methylene tetrahydromethanopterin reductase-like flavin-dependent oxidoreductase (luciferase family)